MRYLLVLCMFVPITSHAVYARDLKPKNLEQQAPEEEQEFPRVKKKQPQPEAAELHLCPNGQYISGDGCHLCPDGTYIGHEGCQLAPDGTYH